MYLNYRDGDRFHISPTVTHFAPSAGLGRTWRRGKVQGIPRISRGQEEGPLVEGVPIALHLTVTTLIGILTILSRPYSRQFFRFNACRKALAETKTASNLQI